MSKLVSYKKSTAEKHRTLTLKEKIDFLDFKKANPELGIRALTKDFRPQIGKTQAYMILKKEESIRQDIDTFTAKAKKRNRSGKYNKINEILYRWYKKCDASGIFPSGAMLQEEAMLIKEALGDEELSGFTATNGWLEKFRISHKLKDKVIVGEAGDVPEETVDSWIERIRELTKGYELRDVWNMDETGCFFQALPARGLVEKGKRAKGGKKSKQRFTLAFFVSADGGKVCDPVVIWKSKKPRCFNRLPGRSTRGLGIQYYSNHKSWMETSIMEAVLERQNSKLAKENRKVLLFIDNATCHPATLEGKYSNINIKFLPKNTTSRLQMLDAGIIQSFKVKYRKKLVKHVVSRIDEDKSASDIIKEVDVLVALRWVVQAWSEVSDETIRKCFKRCGIVEEVMHVDGGEMEENDSEFDSLVKELCAEASASEYASFDDNVDACEPSVNTESSTWRDELRLECIEEEKKNDDDDDDICIVECKEKEEVEEVILPNEVLNLIDRLMKFALTESEAGMLYGLSERVQAEVMKNKKQKTIESYFQKKI